MSMFRCPKRETRLKLRPVIIWAQSVGARHPLGLIAQRRSGWPCPGHGTPAGCVAEAEKTEIEYLFHPKHGPTLGVGFSTWRGPCRPLLVGTAHRRTLTFRRRSRSRTSKNCEVDGEQRRPSVHLAPLPGARRPL